MREDDPRGQRICLWCGKPLEEQGDILHRLVQDDVLCGQCRGGLRSRCGLLKAGKYRVRALYWYEGEGREMLLQYKELMDEALYPAFLYDRREELRKRYRGRTLVPVPSSPSRRKERGFSPVERMFSVLGLPFADILEKEEGEEQKRLSRPQRHLAGRKIHLRKGAVIPRGKILVVDDVLTTGATMEAALDCLQGRKAEGLCVFARRKNGESREILRFLEEIYRGKSLK